MADLHRSRALSGVNVRDARAIALWAPAGFGKTTLARQLARRYIRWQVVDAAADSLGEFARRVVCALDSVDGEAREYAGREDAWLDRARNRWQDPFAGAVVFENCERLAQIDGGEAFLRVLLADTPRPRAVVCCSRSPLDLGFARFALPHETYVLNESDLAFDCDEIRRVLNCSDEDANVVWETTRGWPLCVRMIARIARERPLREVCSRLESASFNTLYDYLIEHIFEIIPEESRACSIAFAAIAHPTHDDIVRLHGEDAEHLRRRALSSGLVAYRDGEYELHPLVRASILRHHAAEAGRILRRAAELCSVADPERAATLYLEAGEPAKAARAIEVLIPESLLQSVVPGVHAICRRLPRATVLDVPKLWARTMVEQPYVGLDRRLRESLHVWEKLGPDEPQRTRLLVAGVLVHALLSLGRLEEARDYYESTIAEAGGNDEDVRFLEAAWRVALDCKTGRYVDARAAFERERPLLKTHAGFYAAAIAEIYFPCARALGSWPGERIHQDIALHYARESKNPIALANLLIECVFGAWLAGDAMQLRAHMVELDALRPLAAGFVRACRTGSIGEFEDELDRPKTRAYAYLIGASVAPRNRRAAFSQDAVAAADAAGDPYLRAVARVAASMIDPARRLPWLEEATACVRNVDATPLREAVAALARGTVPETFCALARHFSDGAAEPQRYHLIVATQSLFRGHERLTLTNREMELLCYLGMREATTSIHELAEAIVPQKDSASAGRMLRVLIARVRKRCDRDIVIYEDGGYRLGPLVTVACREILRRVGRLHEEFLTYEEVAALRRDLAEVRQWSQVVAPAWEWARDLEDYLRSLDVKLTARLTAVRVAS